jgi:hypothetical protein
MSEASTGFLIRGTKEENENDVFSSTSFALNPPLDKFADRLSLLHTAGTIAHKCALNSMSVT